MSGSYASQEELSIHFLKTALDVMETDRSLVRFESEISKLRARVNVFESLPIDDAKLKLGLMQQVIMNQYFDYKRRMSKPIAGSSQLFGSINTDLNPLIARLREYLSTSSETHYLHLDRIKFDSPTHRVYDKDKLNITDYDYKKLFSEIYSIAKISSKHSSLLDTLLENLIQLNYGSDPNKLNSAKAMVQIFHNKMQQRDGAQPSEATKEIANVINPLEARSPSPKK